MSIAKCDRFPDPFRSRYFGGLGRGFGLTIEIIIIIAAVADEFDPLLALQLGEADGRF